MIKLKYPLILASASPRRKDILEMVGLDFEVVTSNYEEPNHSDHLTDVQVFAEEVAVGKGLEVFERLGKKNIVISADTLGIMGDLVLEKPIDREDAKRMLTMLAGKQHTILSSVAVFSPDEAAPLVRSVFTDVYFREISEAEIDVYLDNEAYLDKSASYAMQGKAAVFVEKIVGDYFNIIGLPIVAVWDILRKWER